MSALPKGCSPTGGTCERDYDMDKDIDTDMDTDIRLCVYDIYLYIIIYTHDIQLAPSEDTHLVS